MREFRKNYILRDISNFLKMSVSTYVSNFFVRSSSKTSVNIKTKFHKFFLAVADLRNQTSVKAHENDPRKRSRNVMHSNEIHFWYHLSLVFFSL